jgi:hypothetical protein
MSSTVLTGRFIGYIRVSERAVQDVKSKGVSPSQVGPSPAEFQHAREALEEANSNYSLPFEGNQTIQLLPFPPTHGFETPPPLSNQEGLTHIPELVVAVELDRLPSPLYILDTGLLGDVADSYNMGEKYPLAYSNSRDDAIEAFLKSIERVESRDDVVEYDKDISGNVAIVTESSIPPEAIVKVVTRDNYSTDSEMPAMWPPDFHSRS